MLKALTLNTTHNSALCIQGTHYKHKRHHVHPQHQHQPSGRTLVTMEKIVAAIRLRNRRPPYQTRHFGQSAAAPGSLRPPLTSPALLTTATGNTKLLQFLDMPILALPARRYKDCIFYERSKHTTGLTQCGTRHYSLQCRLYTAQSDPQKTSCPASSKIASQIHQPSAA